MDSSKAEISQTQHIEADISLEDAHSLENGSVEM